MIIYVTLSFIFPFLLFLGNRLLNVKYFEVVLFPVEYLSFPDFCGHKHRVSIELRKLSNDVCIVIVVHCSETRVKMVEKSHSDYTFPDFFQLLTYLIPKMAENLFFWNNHEVINSGFSFKNSFKSYLWMILNFQLWVVSFLCQHKGHNKEVANKFHNFFLILKGTYICLRKSICVASKMFIFSISVNFHQVHFIEIYHFFQNEMILENCVHDDLITSFVG